MKNLSLGKIVGTPTAGVISSPKFCNWGHGYSSLIAECRFTNPDGSDIINTGIQPDVCIEYTESDALGKTDSALTAALKMLKGKKIEQDIIPYQNKIMIMSVLLSHYMA